MIYTINPTKTNAIKRKKEIRNAKKEKEKERHMAMEFNNIMNQRYPILDFFDTKMTKTPYGKISKVAVLNKFFFDKYNHFKNMVCIPNIKKELIIDMEKSHEDLRVQVWFADILTVTNVKNLKISVINLFELYVRMMLINRHVSPEHHHRTFNHYYMPPGYVNARFSQSSTKDDDQKEGDPNYNIPSLKWEILEDNQTYFFSDSEYEYPLGNSIGDTYQYPEKRNNSNYTMITVINSDLFFDHLCMSICTDWNKYKNTHSVMNFNNIDNGYKFHDIKKFINMMHKTFDIDTSSYHNTKNIPFNEVSESEHSWINNEDSEDFDYDGAREEALDLY